ncbi:MAG: extracellular solute-binding protein [Oscillospiraceae bacterium]
MKFISAAAAAMMAATVISGCATKKEREEAETITVYLWSTAMYDNLAPYIQSQLPDVNIQFVVGNNDLDFYKFMNEHGQLPDIITSRRFSLHDAGALKDQLMDLSSTEEAGAIYESYIGNFTNTDGTVNWLPLCGEVDGLVANRATFEKYDIPLPTDYDSLVSACKAFEEEGVRGFAADFTYDYTCMEVLQGLSIPEITSLEGREWRSRYEDPLDTDMTGLDDYVWPGAFERMEQFIEDAGIRPEDIEMSYDPVIEMFKNGDAAIIRAGGSNTVAFQEMGVDAVFLPYFGQDGEQWLLTYPAFQVALNKDLEKDKTRQENALKVLDVMLSEEGQNTLANGEDVITYSQNVDLKLSPHLENLKPLIEQNHLYIRVASNDFFAVSQDVVSKMIQGEYDAAKAYEAFDSQLKQNNDDTDETILTVDKDYSNIFHTKGGNESYSVMANTLRGYYGADVLIAPFNSFTGSVFKADYTEKMTGCMVTPNPLCVWQCELKGSEVKEYAKAYVEGFEGGITPINRGSLPVFSGISVEVEETDGKYTLTRILKDGKEISEDEKFKVALLNIPSYFGYFADDESRGLIKEETRVKNAWIAYIKEGGKLSEPEEYIKVK